MTIKQRFKSSLKRGTGEAHLILLNNPSIDFSGDILDAAVTNFAFDPQCEGSRGLYINELISLSVKKDDIVKAVLTTLSVETNDYWGITQMFDLAKLFAQQGNEEAKKVLYRRFELNAELDIEYCGQHSVIELDGLEGLKKVAEVRGKMLSKNPEDWEDSFVVDNFKSENPTIKVYSELKKAAKSNKFIGAYLKSIQKNKDQLSKRSKRKRYTYQLLKEKIETNKIRYVSDFVVKDLTQDEIEQLATDFLNEQDIKRLEQYLRIFGKIKFPYEPKPIFAIAQKINNNRLVESAIMALSLFQAKDIREFALEKLKQGIEPDVYVNLLTRNYQEGDSELLKRIAHQIRSKNKVHSLTRSYLHIYGVNTTKECKEPLEAIYHKLTCGICRYDLIKLLIKNQSLSNKIKSEALYDCDQETRVLVEGIDSCSNQLS